MSLINDALKRAKDAQKSPPPAAEMQLRPATTTPAPKSAVGMIVPLVAAVCAVAVLLLVWQGRQKTSAREVAVEPKPTTAPTVPPQIKPATTPVVQPAPVVVAAIPTPVVPVAQPKPAAAPAPAPAVSAPVFDLKLKAVFYTPGHPTAIINGKSVQVGTIIKGFRVAALTEVSATLVSATQTNVLRLEQ